MAANQETQTEGLTGLLSLGFAFNPFERLEASNDPYIADCLIGHDMFAVAWETAPAAIFAPAGGGKTAMRIYTLRACWLSNSKRRKFPISYDLPLFASPGDLTCLEAHQLGLAAAAATDLLLACASRPSIYLDLSIPRRLHLLSLLQAALPADLGYALDLLAETADPRALSERLDRTYLLPEPASPAAVRQFCSAAQRDLKDASTGLWGNAALFDALLAFIFEDLSFESVLILLDGVDGSGFQAGNLQAQFELIAPLLNQATAWEEQRVYLKAFLPLELDTYLADQSPIFYQQFLRAEIRWDVPKLAEILRRRVYVASQGRFGSLDAVSSPALRDVETMIAARCRPLPREAITFAGMVFLNYLKRQGEYIESRDISRAEKEYFQRSIFPD